MIVIYTFDFKQFEATRNTEYMMLAVSIQSVLESDSTVTILLYTSDDELRRRIKNDFPSVQIRYRDKEAYCETKFFTCAGHARIATIKDVLYEFRDDVLYMDNDTVVYPNGINNFKLEKYPMGYAKETWNLIGGWFGNNECYKIETARLYGEEMLSNAIINNGIQYFPYNSQSLEIAADISDLYKYLLDTCGYYYGLDMAVFSIVMYDHQLQNQLCFKNRVSETAWHTYMHKFKYLENLFKVGVVVDENGYIHGHEMIYDKLKRASIHGI